MSSLKQLVADLHKPFSGMIKPKVQKIKLNELYPELFPDK